MQSGELCTRTAWLQDGARSDARSASPIGRSGPDMARTNQFWGTIYDRTLIHAQAGGATVRLTGLVNPCIEPEICFHLKSAPPESSDLDVLLDSIDWMAHSVEIVQSHHPGWRFRLPDRIADNGLHGRLVVGEPLSTKQVHDLVERLVDVEIVLRQGDAEIDRGTGANVLGSPLLALAHLVQVLARQREAPRSLPVKW
jgi:2-keto-4-pentenoate hydratase